MAKFRDSMTTELTQSPAVQARPPAPAVGPEGRDRTIGAIISETRNLTADQVESVLKHQRSHGLRFGEAAIALGFVSSDDVLFALSQQFHYPYAPEEQRGQSPELVTLNQPFSLQAEAFRAFRSQAIARVFGEPETERRALAIVSPDRGDGKTYFAANLAVVLAQLGGRTLLVDADMRVPRQHEVFRLQNSAGLSSILSGRAESRVMQQVAGLPSLFVLTTGVTPPNALELIERPAFAPLMRDLSGKFDHVVVDTPAASHGSDSQVIAARCGSALVLARRNLSRVAALRKLTSAIGDGPARVAGVVMNDY